MSTRCCPYHFPHLHENAAEHVFAGSVTTIAPTVWTQQQRFTGNDAEGFGQSVALSGDTALVMGHFVGVYAFARTDAVWMQEQELTVGPFVSSVALSGDTALVGADLDGATGNQGSVIVRIRTKGSKGTNPWFLFKTRAA